MKVLFFLFVAANVALYVWATQATPKAESGLPQPRVGHNLSRMTLDSEQFGEASKPTNCLRIGPFSTQQTLVDGRRMLVNRGYGLAQQRTTAREVHSHQVLAGPFLSDIARDNARIKLKDSDIPLREHRPGRPKISFSTRVRGRRAGFELPNRDQCSRVGDDDREAYPQPWATTLARCAGCRHRRKTPAVKGAAVGGCNDPSHADTLSGGDLGQSAGHTPPDVVKYPRQYAKPA